MSPYAAIKLVNDFYADVFVHSYRFKSIGLRYFNIFGKRHNPNGVYAAVTPKWIIALIQKGVIFANGNGETSRDFCYVDNAVQANLLAATTQNLEVVNQIHNVAAGERFSLSKLYNVITASLEVHRHLPDANLNHRDFRALYVRHSLASINKSQTLLDYVPAVKIKADITAAVPWRTGKAAEM